MVVTRWLTLAHMSTPGRDIKLATSRIEGNRNFATKLWNAARFCEMNECTWVSGFDPATIKHTVNQWIVGELKLATDKVAALLDDYRFDLAASAAYDFAWNNFCDWYLEFTKPIIGGTDEVGESRNARDHGMGAGADAAYTASDHALYY